MNAACGRIISRVLPENEQSHKRSDALRQVCLMLTDSLQDSRFRVRTHGNNPSQAISVAFKKRNCFRKRTVSNVIINGPVSAAEALPRS